MASGEEVATLQGYSANVTSIAFSLDGSRLASTSGPPIYGQDGESTIMLWDVANGKEVATLRGHSGRVTSVAFSADGRHLASGSWDETVKLWDFANEREVATLRGHSSHVTSVAFSPDGSRLASGSWGGTVRLWDMPRGKEVVTMRGHPGNVSRVAFSPNGCHLVSAYGGRSSGGLWNNSVKVWDAVCGEEEATLQAHLGQVLSVVFSPDGSRLALGLKDKTIKLWDVHVVQQTPDVMRLQRQGVIRLEGRGVVWNTNTSLCQSLSFKPIHYRSDEIAELASDLLSEDAREVLRLKLMAKSGQWRPAVAYWRGLDGPDPKAREVYLTMLLVEARHMLGTGRSLGLGELIQAITSEIRPMDAAGTRLTLPMARLLRELAFNKGEASADNSAGELLAEIKAGSAKETLEQSFAGFIHSLNSGQITYQRLLGEKLRAYDAAWVANLERLLEHPEVVADDFAAAAYKAAQEPSREELARKVLEVGLKRFADSERMQMMAGWTWIVLGNPAGARTAFQASQKLDKAGDASNTDLLAGLSIAQWLTGDRGTAMTTYGQLIEAGRKQEKPTDWAKAGTISNLTWPEAETKPLEEIRKATLKKYPELVPKVEDSKE